jgi:adenine-specific DNA methylase
MVKYSCETCQKTFAQRGHLEDHQNRKRPCKKDNTIEALVEQKVKEALSKTNEEAVKIDTTTSSQMQSSTMDYAKKTREELIAICKEKSIKGYSGKKKSEILILLENKTAVVSNDSHATENIIVSKSVELTETLTTKFPMPQYLGSKTKYIEHILKYIPTGVESILDAFSGSGIVSYAFKQNNYRTLSNDLLSYNAIITKALIENQNIKLTDEDIEMLLSDNPLKENFIEREFTDLYYTKDECIFLDNLHSNILKLENEYKRALAFASIGRTLIRKILFAYFCHTKAIDYRKDEKHWKRNPVINSDMKALFRKYITEYNNAVINNKKDNTSFNTNILLSANTFDVDLVYMDPPYGGTHADYGSYYHFIETYINYWKDEELFNTTKQPKNKLTKSKFATKDVVPAFEELFEKCKNIKYWMISYNSNANPKKDKFIEMIQKYKKNIDIKEISLSNNNGGMGLRKDSKEYLFICY